MTRQSRYHDSIIEKDREKCIEKGERYYRDSEEKLQKMARERIIWRRKRYEKKTRKK